MATSAERLAQYEDLFNTSQAFNPAQFQQDFEKAYGEKTNYNRDLIEQQSGALGQLQAVAPELRQRYSNTLIKDPTLQRSLIAQARQAPIADYSTAVNLLGQRGQRYADVLQSALGGYQTSANQAQTAAESAWRMYESQVAQEEAARSRAAASGGLTIKDIMDLINGENVEDNVIPKIKVKDSNWAQKLIRVLDKTSSPLTGSDYTSVKPTLASYLVNAINPVAAFGSTAKTVGGGVGNLVGNWRNDDMSFWDKLFNRRK